MARTHGARPKGKAAASSTEAMIRKINPAPSTGSGYTDVTASKALLPGNAATSKVRSAVEGRYGSRDTTPSTSPELERHPPQTGSTDAEPETQTETWKRRAKLRAPVLATAPTRHAAGRTNREGKGQYGPCTKGGPAPETTASRHNRLANQDLEKSFTSDAAEARRARLKYEAIRRGPNGASTRSPPDPQGESAEGRGTATVEAWNSARPVRGTGTSAAERVRSILSPDPSRTGSANKNGPGDKSNEARVTTSATRGDKRNTKRLRDADAADHETIGESQQNVVHPFTPGHLPGDASLFILEPAAGPCDEFDPLTWFLAAIEAIYAAPSEVPTKSPIRFELSDEA